MNHKLLVIANNWPESATTASGVHLLYVLDSFKKQGLSIHFACSSQPSIYSDDLVDLIDNQHSIALNDDSFNELLEELQPEIVLFDRFLSEEQYGWRVYECCPKAITIVNTEDVHSLREARAKGLDLDQWKASDLFYRECASFLRVDKVLLVSRFEMALFRSISWIEAEKFIYVPIVAHKNAVSIQQKRSGACVFFGSGKHPANNKTLEILINWWPKINAQFPHFQLTIYGAYYSSALIEKLKVIDGIFFKGWVKDIDSEIASMRYLIAPIPFGAGLKGKVLKAIENRVLVLTSSIGSEGIDQCQNDPLMNLSTFDEYIAALGRIESDSSIYESNLKQQFELLDCFDSKTNADWINLTLSLNHTESAVEQPQLKMLLRHQTINSSRNLGKYLTLKNLLKAEK